jgi:hypothetical protein
MGKYCSFLTIEVISYQLVDNIKQIKVLPNQHWIVWSVRTIEPFARDSLFLHFWSRTMTNHQRLFIWHHYTLMTVFQNQRCDDCLNLEGSWLPVRMLNNRWKNWRNQCIMSGFHRVVNVIFALLGCYAAQINSYSLTFRDTLSVFSSRFKGQGSVS